MVKIHGATIKIINKLYPNYNQYSKNVVYLWCHVKLFGNIPSVELAYCGLV
jgi:hypothetical protein